MTADTAAVLALRRSEIRPLAFAGRLLAVLAGALGVAVALQASIPSLPAPLNAPKPSSQGQLPSLAAVPVRVGAPTSEGTVTLDFQPGTTALAAASAMASYDLRLLDGAAIFGTYTFVLPAISTVQLDGTSAIVAVPAHATETEVGAYLTARHLTLEHWVRPEGRSSLGDDRFAVVSLPQVNRPGFDGGSISWEDGAHARKTSPAVPGRAA